MSHVDTFDYKPEPVRVHGKSLVSDEKPDVFFGQIGLLPLPDWAVSCSAARAACGSRDLLPNIAEVADELTVINSMYAETSNHTPAMFQENSGFRLNGFPGWELAVVRPGLRDRQLASLRGDSRRTRAASRRLDQLDQRLFAGAAPGRGHPRAGQPDRRLVPARPDYPKAERATRDLLGHDEPRGTWPSARRPTRSSRASQPTSWRRACNWPCPKWPTWTAKPPTTQ